MYRIDCRAGVSSLRPMRSIQALALALLGVLLVAAPAGAEDASVSVPDFEFAPTRVQVDPGDTVTWNFVGPTDHTATSARGESERWDSGFVQAGQTYERTFENPGRWSYYCRPHPFMKGSVTVGEDDFAKSFKGAKVAGANGSLKVSLRLLEDAKVTVSVKGPKRKKVTKSLDAGKRSVKVGRLREGSYKVTVVAQDAFDVKTTKRAKTAVG